MRIALLASFLLCLATSLATSADQPKAIQDATKLLEAALAKSKDATEQEKLKEAIAALKKVGQPAAAEQTTQEFVAAKLAELDGFKSDVKFTKFGFGVGGPYNGWLVAVESRYKSTKGLDAIPVGDLLNLGLEYMKTRGEENKFTKFAREEILKVVKPAKK